MKMENQAHLELSDPLEASEKLDQRDLLENLVTLDLKVYLAYKDNLGLLDPQVHLDLLVKLLQPHRL